MFATRMLHAAARMVYGKLLADQMLVAAKKLAEVGEDHYDATFYKSKIATARFLYPERGSGDLRHQRAAIKAADFTRWRKVVPKTPLM